MGKRAAPHNKGLKLTRPAQIGALQLNPSVGPTWRWSMTLAAILALLCSTAQAQAPVAAPTDRDLAHFTQLESLWNDAHLRGDADALDRLWTDDFRVFVPGMTPMSKADALAFFRSGRMKFLRYETSDVDVRSTQRRPSSPVDFGVLVNAQARWLKTTGGSRRSTTSG